MPDHHATVTQTKTSTGELVPTQPQTETNIMKTTITTGTCHFRSRYAAIRYYEKQGLDVNDVVDKIARREISYREPELKPGQRLKVDEDGRYHIEEEVELPTPKLAQSALFELPHGNGFDTLEVHTVYEDHDQHVEQIAAGDEIPDDCPHYWSLYGHVTGEGLHCIGDFNSFEAACDMATKLGGQLEPKQVNDWTRERFIIYLNETLIPDLKSSGYEATAEDFETAIQFMS